MAIKCKSHVKNVRIHAIFIYSLIRNYFANHEYRREYCIYIQEVSMAKQPVINAEKDLTKLYGHSAIIDYRHILILDSPVILKIEPVRYGACLAGLLIYLYWTSSIQKRQNKCTRDYYWKTVLLLQIPCKY